MMRLPIRLSQAQRAKLAAYRAALDQHGLPFLGNARQQRRSQLDFAFALGLSCGIELAQMHVGELVETEEVCVE